MTEASPLGGAARWPAGCRTVPSASGGCPPWFYRPEDGGWISVRAARTDGVICTRAACIPWLTLLVFADWDRTVTYLPVIELRDLPLGVFAMLILLLAL